MIKLKTFLLLAVSMMLVSTVSAQTLNEIIEKYNEGAQFLKAKQYDQSIASLKSAIDMAQTSTEEGALELGDKANTLLGMTYTNKGKALASSRNFDAALKEFGEAEAIYSSVNDIRNLNTVNMLIAKTYEVKAVSQNKEGNVDGAIATCEAGLERNPNSTDLALFLAKLRYTKGDTQAAFDEYKKLYEYSKRSSRYAKVADAVDNALMANASEAAKENKVQLAEDNIDLVLANNPANAIAQMQRVQVYNAAKDYNNVVKYADDAINAQTDPNNKATLNFIAGAACQVLGNNEGAINYYNKVTTGQYQAKAKEIVASLTKK